MAAAQLAALVLVLVVLVDMGRVDMESVAALAASATEVMA
jgi:hypothetical protein